MLGFIGEFAACSGNAPFQASRWETEE